LAPPWDSKSNFLLANLLVLDSPATLKVCCQFFRELTTGVAAFRFIILDRSNSTTLDDRLSGVGMGEDCPAMDSPAPAEDATYLRERRTYTCWNDGLSKRDPPFMDDGGEEEIETIARTSV
jgi:hypothetical protein